MVTGVEAEAAKGSINHTRRTAHQDQPTKDRKTLLPHLNGVLTITHVISHPIEHKASMLGKWLPSIKRDIVVLLHVGCIKSFIENWSLIAQDPWILQAFQGFQLPLVDCPSQTSTRVEVSIRSDRNDHGRGTGTLKQRCHQSGPGQHRGVPILDIYHPQEDGGYHSVINLTALNNHILEEHFKMEGFHMVKELIRPQDWLAKVDLKDAYLLVL